MALTVESFTDLFGFGPQEYFNKLIASTASGWRVDGTKAKIAAWQAQLAALPTEIPDDGREIDGLTHFGLRLRKAELETWINEAKGLVHGDEVRQKTVQDFLDGKTDTALEALVGGGSFIQALIDAGLVDPTKRP